MLALCDVCSVHRTLTYIGSDTRTAKSSCAVIRLPHRVVAQVPRERVEGDERHDLRRLDLVRRRLDLALQSGICRPESVQQGVDMLIAGAQISPSSGASARRVTILQRMMTNRKRCSEHSAQIDADKHKTCVDHVLCESTGLT